MPCLYPVFSDVSTIPFILLRPEIKLCSTIKKRQKFGSSASCTTGSNFKEKALLDLKKTGFGYNQAVSYLTYKINFELDRVSL